MNTVRQVARRAAHRRTLRRFVSALSTSLGAAFGAAFVLVLLDRLFALASLRDAPWWLAPAAAGALGLAGAALWAMLAPRDTLAAAGEVDANLRLHDRLASALQLADRAEEDPFVGLTVRQAEEIAANVRLARAVPVRITPRWWSWTALAACTIVASLFLPRADLLGRDESAQRQVALAAERERAREQIEQAAQHAEELVEQAAADPALADPVRTEQLEVLDRLRDQLAGGSTESDAARSEAARALDEIAEEFAREAEDAHAQQDAVRELLGSLEHADPVSGEDAVTPAAPDAASALAADELAESLRRGDLESAANQLEALQQRAARMPAEQRERTAQQLRRLAEEIDKAAQQQRAEQERAQEEQSESLRNRGLDDQSIRELQQERDEERIREHLEKQGMDEDAARRLADDLAEQNRRREAERKAAEDASQISEGLKQSAEELRQDHPPPGEPQNGAKDGAAQPRPGAQKPGDPQTASPPQKDGAQPGEPGEQAEPTGQSRDQSNPPGTQMPSPTTSPQGIQKSQEQKSGEQGEPRQGTHGESGAPSSSQPKPGEGTPSSPPNQPGTREGKPESSKQEQGQHDATSPQPDDSGRPGPGESPKPGSAPGADPGAPPPGQPGPDGKPSESPAGSPGSPEGKPAPTDASGGGQPGSSNRQPSPGAPGQGRPDPSSPAVPGSASQPGAPGSKPGRSDQPNEQVGSGGESSPGGTGSGAGKGGMSGLKEKLKDMARRGAAADQRRQSAEELRREAERLLSEMSPQEREELKRWAMEQLKEQGGDVSGERENASGAPDAPGMSDDSGFRTETVDARSRGSDGKVVAEINDPGRRNEGRALRDQRAVSNREVREQLREAIQSTERAMEDRVVPTRYRNVKEYFRKALERAEAQKAAQDEAPAPDPPKIEDAKDVEKKPAEAKKP